MSHRSICSSIAASALLQNRVGAAPIAAAAAAAGTGTSILDADELHTD